MGHVPRTDGAPRDLLLPDVLPLPDAVTAARRHRSGGTDGSAGADWCDVIRLSGGRAAFVAGDVVGRGAAAARARSQLRTAVLTLAVLDLPPDDVLVHLDELAREDEQAQLATCVYAVYDPVRRRLQYAGAGHLPPILLVPGAAPALLPVPSGAPLGVGGVPFELRDVPVADGAVLLLYTDGLVELRSRHLDSALVQLLDAVREAVGPGEPPDPDTLGERVLASSVAGPDPTGGADHGNDVALLVAQLNGIAPDRQAAWAVPASYGAVSRAREHVTRQLERWGLGVLADTAALLVSEVLTNSIRYARHPITLSMLSLRDRIEVAVADNDGRLPLLRRAGEHDEGGRGLHLVEALSTRWGARPSGAGKVVWFALARPGA